MFMNCGQTALIRAKTFDKRLSRNIFSHRHPLTPFAYVRDNPAAAGESISSFAGTLVRVYSDRHAGITAARDTTINYLIERR